MAESKSRGVVQVGSNDVAEINRALALLSQWIDELTGLRGTIRVYDALEYKDAKGTSLHSLVNRSP